MELVATALCAEPGSELLSPLPQGRKHSLGGGRRLHAHLQEDGRVLLVDLHQLHVGDGVDAAHGQARHGHDHSQDHHIVAQGDDGKDQGDGEGRGKERKQRLSQPEGGNRDRRELVP